MKNKKWQITTKDNLFWTLEETDKGLKIITPKGYKIKLMGMHILDRDWTTLELEIEKET